MNEKDIAHQYNNLGRDPTFPGRDRMYRLGRKRSGFLGDPLFRDNIAASIESIPANFLGMKHCPACEEVSCGICGTCHDVDRRDWQKEPACPAARSMQNIDTVCVVWSYAYLFLKKVQRK